MRKILLLKIIFKKSKKIIWKLSELGEMNEGVGCVQSAQKNHNIIGKQKTDRKYKKKWIHISNKY